MVDLLEGEPPNPEVERLDSMLNWILRFLRGLKRDQRFNDTNRFDFILKLTDFWNDTIDILEKDPTKGNAHVRSLTKQQFLHQYDA